MRADPFFLFPFLGGSKAFKAVREQVRDEDVQVKDAAVRTLAEWQDVQALDTLLAISKNSDSETHRVLARRGYVRLLNLNTQTGAVEKKAKSGNRADKQFTPLFDGTTFTGFEGDLDWFRIEDGALIAGKLTERIPHNFFLSTTKEYYNFELRLKARTSNPTVNGGIQFRSKRIPNHHEVRGYQADIAKRIWGALYDESRRKKFLVPPHAKAQKTVKENDWNDYRIRCFNDRIQLFVNGIMTVDYTEPDPAIAKQPGIIAFQIHGGRPAEVSYKDITIKEL